MSDDRSNQSDYEVSPGLLARKGNAEPLSKSGISLILASEKSTGPTDDEQLTQAVIGATLAILDERPGGGRTRAAAPLTDLLDPALINALRRS